MPLRSEDLGERVLLAISDITGAISAFQFAASLEKESRLIAALGFIAATSPPFSQFFAPGVSSCL